MLIPLPEFLRDRAHHDLEPVPTKDAATIVVVRDGESDLECFLMRRQSTMAFAPGMYVFPGGGVQDDDGDDVPRVGPEWPEFAERLLCPPELAGALVVAAVRETFEETGVLLAGPDGDTVVADTSEYHDAREALENREYSFASFLKANDLVLRADLIGVWSHWITPAFEPRRYDTRFFVAALPEGQRIDTVGREADRSLWAPLSEVIAKADSGDFTLLPPTIATCRELVGESARTVLDTASRRTIEPIEPKLVHADGRWWLDIRDDEHRRWIGEMDKETP